MNWLRIGFLMLSGVLYQQLAKRLLFKMTAQHAHEELLKLLTWADRTAWVIRLAAWLQRWLFVKRPLQVGGVTLHYPFIVAAGLVKGEGFATEQHALMTVTHNTNIMPGWKIIPALLGAVEFGSFTRYPRMGNHGIVMWRDELTQSTQNRVGLKNPGIRLAAQFLAQRWAELPPIWGLNIAVTPGVTDDAQAVQEVVESITIVLQQIQPTWFTLNISCPNTEDDPSGQQTEQKTRLLCRAAVAALHEAQIPLWVKISPDLSETQYALLLRVFQEEGVAAVIATNTLAQPAPNDASVNAGVGGGKLHTAAMTAVAHLAVAKIRQQATIDIIGCGGLLNGNSYRDFKTLGVEVVQYWSALVFRGPLAAPIIESELPDVRNEPVPTTIDRASIIAN